MSVFLLATAVVGLVSALDQFAELLPLAREVSACVCACPGLARVSERCDESEAGTSVKRENR